MIARSHKNQSSEWVLVECYAYAVLVLLHAVIPGRGGGVAVDL